MLLKIEEVEEAEAVGEPHFGSSPREAHSLFFVFFSSFSSSFLRLLLLMKVDFAISDRSLQDGILTIQTRLCILQAIQPPAKGSLARHRSRGRPTKGSGAIHILHPKQRTFNLFSDRNSFGT